MKDRCQSKNPATCRHHGAGKALTVIETRMEDKGLSYSQQFNLAKLKAAATDFNPNNKATGLLVEYENGETELFVGSATDPYKETDYSFSSVETRHELDGVVFDEHAEEGDYEPLDRGPQTVERYQRDFNEQLVDSIPVFQEGNDNYKGETKVKSVTVI